jgi:hypothetical protein
LGVLVAVFSAAPAEAERVYWADRGANLIQSANHDGTDVQTVISATEPSSVELDLAAGMIYWTARAAGQGVIGRAQLDGSSAETVLSTGAALPLSIALDASVGKMFWTADAGSDSKVMRADLDGQNVEELDSSPSTTPRAIALDRVNQRFYWGVQIGAGYLIRRANYDGSGVIEISLVGSPGDGNSTYGIAVDSLRAKIYWTAGSDCVPCDQLVRADLDGSNQELIASGLFEIKELAIAENDGQIYWCETFFDDTGFGSRVVRANLDAKNISTYVTGLDDAIDVTIDPGGDLVPATSPSSVALLVSVLGVIATIVLLRRRRIDPG